MVSWIADYWNMNYMKVVNETLKLTSKALIHQPIATNKFHNGNEEIKS